MHHHLHECGLTSGHSVLVLRWCDGELLHCFDLACYFLNSQLADFPWQAIQNPFSPELGLDSDIGYFGSHFIATEHELTRFGSKNEP